VEILGLIKPLSNGNYKIVVLILDPTEMKQKTITTADWERVQPPEKYKQNFELSVTQPFMVTVAVLDAFPTLKIKSKFKSNFINKYINNLYIQ
jgi:hypothetical protein